MNKIVCIGAMLLSFSGIALANDTPRETTDKTETSTTLTGKKKVKHTEKIDNGNGTTTEINSETVTPKNAKNTNSDDKGAKNVVDRSSKSETGTTMTGKKYSKTTNKMDSSNGSSTEKTVETKTK